MPTSLPSGGAICSLETPTACPCQAPSVSSLASSTAIQQFPKPLGEELCSSKTRLCLNLCQSAKHSLSDPEHTLLILLGSGLLRLGASLSEGCRCPILNQAFGKTLGGDGRAALLSGGAFRQGTLLIMHSHIAAAPVAIPVLQLATHLRWTQVWECKEHTWLVHKASLALGTEHLTLEQPERKEEPRAKGAQSRRAREYTGKHQDILLHAPPILLMDTGG